MSRPGSSGSPASGLRRSAAWALAGNAVYAGTQWLALVALARLGSPATVGQFALGMAICAPVMLLSSLQLRSVLATDARDEHAWPDYLGLRVLTTALALLALAAIAGLGYGGDTAHVIALAGVAKAIEGVSDLYYGLLQKHERMDVMARSLILRGLLGLGALVAGLALGGDVRVAVAGMAGAWAVVLAVHDVPAAAAAVRSGTHGRLSGRLSEPLAGAHAPRWRRTALVALVRLALPLGVTTMFLSLQQNIPRYVVEHHLGEAALGIFAAMAYVQVAGEIAIRALGQTAMPRLARHWAAGERAAFDALLLRLLALGAALGAAAVALAAVAGELVLDVLFGAAYAAEAAVFTWVMVAAALTWLGSLLGYAASATRAFARFTAPYAAVTAVALIAAVALVPRHGLMGAAWALGVTGAATCLAPLAVLASQRAGQRRDA
jgi:O-antigen/teichoic acid export membrane protein